MCGFYRDSYYNHYFRWMVFVDIRRHQRKHISHLFGYCRTSFWSSCYRSIDHNCNLFYRPFKVIIWSILIFQSNQMLDFDMFWLTITFILFILSELYRPNFFAWCKPNWGQIDCGNSTHPKLVTEYVCEGTDEENFAGQESKAKMSFVSGHASFSCQSATFVVLYLQSRSAFQPKLLKDYYLLVPFIQVVMIVFAFFTCLSRVMDYQHHPGDVIGNLIWLIM